MTRELFEVALIGDFCLSQFRLAKKYSQGDLVADQFFRSWMG